MNRFLIAIMLLLTATAICGERETIRDTHGKVRQDNCDRWK